MWRCHLSKSEVIFLSRILSSNELILESTRHIKSKSRRKDSEKSSVQFLRLKHPIFVQNLGDYLADFFYSVLPPFPLFKVLIHLF
jgi:hypothetical protein